MGLLCYISNNNNSAVHRLSSIIAGYSRPVPAVRKHIIPQEALSGAGVGVRVEEALDDWIVISALEVIEARLSAVVIPF